MTQRKRPPPKTTPVCCKIKTCPYPEGRHTKNACYFTHCTHLKADWRTP